MDITSGFAHQDAGRALRQPNRLRIYAESTLEDLVLVSDMELIAAQQYFIAHEGIAPELAAASTLAAAEKIKNRLTPERSAGAC